MDEENELKRFWAYRHIDGHIHVRRFFDLADVEDAYDSDFVDDVLEPFQAKNRAEAEGIARGRWRVILDTPPDPM